MVRYFYVDESWNDEKFCLTAISVRHSDWHTCLKKIQEHRANLFRDFGFYSRREIHARDLVGGRGNVAVKQLSRGVRAKIFTGLLELVSRLPNVFLINVCLDQKGRKDAQEAAWNRLLNRIERTMLEYENREVPIRKRALQELRPDEPSDHHSKMEMRLLCYNPRAMIVPDAGNESEITKLMRKMAVYNPIPSKRGIGAVAAYRNIPVERVIEDPIFRDSAKSFLIQLADCVAFALLKRESTPTANVQKHKLNELFERCVGPICLRAASPSDKLGIVRK